MHVANLHLLESGAFPLASSPARPRNEGLHEVVDAAEIVARGHFAAALRTRDENHPNGVEDLKGEVLAQQPELVIASLSL